VRALGGLVVRGNHDHAASHRVPLDWFNPLAAAAIRWTRLALSAENRDWLRDLPYEGDVAGRAHVVHGALHDPRHWPYLFDAGDAGPHFPHQTMPLCFVGHTHVPIVLAKIGKRVYESKLEAFRGAAEEGAKVVVNAGSVGQPRDGNPKACYLLYDPAEGLVVPRRVEYDPTPAASKILAAGLPKQLALRLFLGR
jgi:diadenosine tetraphosphatase ApaH/serine/threonine PP2A family protein phosphatase